RSYTPPFGYYLGHENAFRVVAADFVTTGDGTGLVHTAGAFGEDDKVITDRENIEAVMPVGPDGKFTPPVTDYAGQLVFDANAPIIADLKADRKSTRLNSSHVSISYAVFCLKKKMKLEKAVRLNGKISIQ